MLTFGLVHGDRLDEVLSRHVQLALVLHRTEETKSVLLRRHVHVSVFKVKLSGLQQNTKKSVTFFLLPGIPCIIQNNYVSVTSLKQNRKETKGDA